MKIMKIMWFSRHNPLYSQMDALGKVFGKFSLVIHPNPFRDAEHVASEFRKSGADELVVVAPLSVVSKLCENGLRPLYAEMEVCDATVAETSSNGRHYRFVRFRRVTGVDVRYEDFE